MKNSNSFWKASDTSCSARTGEMLIVHRGEMPSATSRRAASSSGR
jgi:hypothetical protein